MIAAVFASVALPVVLAVALVWFAFFSRAAGILRAGVCVCLVLAGWSLVPDSLTMTAQQTNGGPYADSDPPTE